MVHNDRLAMESHRLDAGWQVQRDLKQLRSPALMFDSKVSTDRTISLARACILKSDSRKTSLTGMRRSLTPGGGCCSFRAGCHRPKTNCSVSIGHAQAASSEARSSSSVGATGEAAVQPSS